MAKKIPIDAGGILDRIMEVYGFEKEGQLSKFLQISSGRLANWRARNSVDFNLLVTRCKGANLHYIITGKGPKLVPEDDIEITTAPIGRGEFIVTDVNVNVVMESLADYVKRKSQKDSELEAKKRKGRAQTEPRSPMEGEHE